MGFLRKNLGLGSDVIVRKWIDDHYIDAFCPSPQVINGVEHFSYLGVKNSYSGEFKDIPHGVKFLDTQITIIPLSHHYDSFISIFANRKMSDLISSGNFTKMVEDILSGHFPFLNDIIILGYIAQINSIDYSGFTELEKVTYDDGRTEWVCKCGFGNSMIGSSIYTRDECI